MDKYQAERARVLQELGGKFVHIDMSTLVARYDELQADLDSLRNQPWSPLVGEAITYNLGRASVFSALINGEAL